MTISKFQSSIQLWTRAYSNVPAFLDVFDEETFYITAAVITVSTFVVAMLLARYVKIKEVEW